MRNIYNISYSRVALLLLPIVLRKRTIIAFLSACMRPLEMLSAEFDTYRHTIDTSIKSQTAYLRGLLNDEFDYYARRIKVRTVQPDFDSLLTWDITTDKRILVGEKGSGKEFLRNASGQLGKNIPAFKVVFPVGVSLSESEANRVKTLVNNNKLASKQYTISYE